MNSPKVVVLILSYNGKHLLEDSVSTYLANTYPNFKVVVIDNGSSDGTKEYVERNFPDAIVHRTEKNRAYSGGFNFGLEFAFGELAADYVLITNNDVKVPDDVIEQLVIKAEKSINPGFVTGKVYFYDSPEILQTVGKKEDPVLWNGGHIGNKEKDEGQYEQEAERFFADDIFTLVPRKLYETVGGYDTEFRFQGEEYDWQARGKNAGFKIYYTPKAKIWHKESMTIGKASPFKYYFDARNPSIVILKHQTPEFFKKYFRYHFTRRVLWNTLIQLKNLRFAVAYNIWKGFFSSVIWGIKNNKFTLSHFI